MREWKENAKDEKKVRKSNFEIFSSENNLIFVVRSDFNWFSLLCNWRSVSCYTGMLFSHWNFHIACHLSQTFPVNIYTMLNLKWLNIMWFAARQKNPLLIKLTVQKLECFGDFVLIYLLVFVFFLFNFRPSQTNTKKEIIKRSVVLAPIINVNNLKQQPSQNILMAKNANIFIIIQRSRQYHGKWREKKTKTTGEGKKLCENRSVNDRPHLMWTKAVKFMLKFHLLLYCRYLPAYGWIRQ